MMNESDNLLDDSSKQEERLYHEMEMTEQPSVETRDTPGCINISGSTRYLIAAMVASLGGVLFGYDLGIVSGAMLQLKEDFRLDCQQQEMIVSSMLFGALLGSLAGGYIIDFFGRRRTIIINAFVFFTGALILAFAPTYSLLIVGRLIVGFGTSLSAIAECIYIAEIAPPKRRGLLVSLNEIGIVCGLLSAYLVNYMFINTDNGWRYMFGLSGIPALIQGYGIIFLPPSPRWLVCQGQDAKALRVMRLLDHADVVPEEAIEKMKDALNLEHKYNICYLFGHHENMRDRMFVGLGIVFFQQFTGQPSVLYYAPLIFENIGFRSHSAATLATVGIGLTKLVATVVTLFLVDKAGRRRFFLAGSIIMTVSICLLFTVTLCSPGSYHHGICENPRGHGSPPINATSPSPSYTFMTTTCVYHVNNRSTLAKDMKLSVQPSFTTLPILNTNFYNASKTQSFRSFTQLELQTSTTIIRVNSPLFSSKPQLDQSEVRLLCYPQPSPSGVETHIATKKRSTNESDDEIPSFVKYLTVFSLMAFAGGYSAGYGPVSWLVLSEIFPTAIKGRAFAATTVLNWTSNLVVSLTMLDLLDSIGVSWTFFLYAILGLLAIIFIFKFVPETKNRSLEEINALFSTRTSVLQDCSCLPSTRVLCCNHYKYISSGIEQDNGLLFDQDMEVES
ncbi:solute carrier family 2, facilitated glucose transporter member 10-like [Dendronephthya gigantea]|uniref:solute carrier family 2, facilitated glucose transporter member 10-like n=1 Tax=Dendronephthya gigantea TaxID=151771 RepID=UPI00106CAD44|nr:solute carrier family 2, facilitated glucose transporter member 10-like [Dendronephthya gigantea]